MIKTRKQAKVAQHLCVSCGCCVKSCPVKAVTVHRGMYARIDTNRCVGCGKCVVACPAAVIQLLEVRHEKTMV